MDIGSHLKRPLIHDEWFATAQVTRAYLKKIEDLSGTGDKDGYSTKLEKSPAIYSSVGVTAISCVPKTKTVEIFEAIVVLKSDGNFAAMSLN